MSLLALVIILICLGVLLWAVKAYIPMDESLRKIVTIVVVIIAVLLVLNAFGVIDAIRGVQVPRLSGR